jgi:hypothetical protein
MFVARGKTGPFRVEVEPIAGVEGVVAAHAVMRDEGVRDRDRVTTVGWWVFRQV